MKQVSLFLTLLTSVALVAQTTTNVGVNSGTQGNDNSFFGVSTGQNSEGNENTFMGYQSGMNNSGSQNTFIGISTGTFNQATQNTFVERASGYYNTTGEFNTFIGNESGLNNTTGKWSTFLGRASSTKNIIGSSNTSIGVHAGYSNISGSNNVSLGIFSNNQNTNGSNNTIIGSKAGFNNLGSGSVFFGYNAGANETGSNKPYIANSDTDKPLGKIHTKEVKVDLTGWPDFVFENDYDLPTLKEVETHIKEKGHLANIPSAEEVKKEGIFLGEMNAKLFQKIEELTLYTIQQQKELQNQIAINKSLGERLQKIETLLETKK